MTSTISFAAAICSMVCGGIATGRMANLSGRKRVGNMKMLLSILSAAALVLPAGAQARAVINKGDVVVVPVRGDISLSMVMFLRWNCHGPNGKLIRQKASWKYEDVIDDLECGRACPAGRCPDARRDSQRRRRSGAFARRDLALDGDVLASRGETRREQWRCRDHF